MANGFSYASKTDWSNMGQGAPYTGPLPGASPRPEGIDFNDYDCDIHEYAPTVGLKALREAVAVSSPSVPSRRPNQLSLSYLGARGPWLVIRLGGARDTIEGVALRIRGRTVACAERAGRTAAAYQPQTRADPRTCTMSSTARAKTRSTRTRMCASCPAAVLECLVWRQVSLD